MQKDKFISTRNLDRFWSDAKQYIDNNVADVDAVMQQIVQRLQELPPEYAAKILYYVASVNASSSDAKAIGDFAKSHMQLINGQQYLPQGVFREFLRLFEKIPEQQALLNDRIAWIEERLPSAERTYADNDGYLHLCQTTVVSGGYINVDELPIDEDGYILVAETDIDEDGYIYGNCEITEPTQEGTTAPSFDAAYWESYINQLFAEKMAGIEPTQADAIAISNFAKSHMQLINGQQYLPQGVFREFLRLFEKLPAQMELLQGNSEDLFFQLTDDELDSVFDDEEDTDDPIIDEPDQSPQEDTRPMIEAYNANLDVRVSLRRSGIVDATAAWEDEEHNAWYTEYPYELGGAVWNGNNMSTAWGVISLISE